MAPRSSRLSTSSLTSILLATKALDMLNCCTKTEKSFAMNLIKKRFNFLESDPEQVVRKKLASIVMNLNTALETKKRWQQ